MGWVASCANKWQGYSRYLGEGAGIARTWATAHFLTFYGQPGSCPGTCGRAIYHVNISHECVMTLKAAGS